MPAGGSWARTSIGLVASALALAAAFDPQGAAAAPDALAAGFAKPPPSARPRAWWHWLNGNITREGVLEDLDWMKRVGLGGVQAFDVNQNTPQIVDRRIVYMSPEWKQVFHDAVQRADTLGLELGVASSPGWSETGGPWVRPEQAMKKLVWSEVQVTGGRPVRAVLPPLPAVAGPYQDLPAGPQGHKQVDGFARDVAVIAWRAEAETLPAPAGASVNDAPLDPAALGDGGLHGAVPLPPSQAGGPGVIQIEYTAPQTVRSAVVFVADLPENAIAGPLRPTLEASDDGRTWRKVTEIPLSPTPSTASFAPVTARHFRLVLTRGRGLDRSSFAIAPGIDLGATAGFAHGVTASPRLAEFRLLGETQVNAFEQKAGFALADDYYALDAHVGDDAKGVSPASVIDLTAKMRPDGQLDWTPPPGRWTVLRLGYSLTGKTNAPATDEATGLEADKYDAAAVADYLETYLASYRQAVGDDLMGSHGLRAMVTDSIEAGPSNWTPRLIEQFQALRGYDPRPWLPALTGTIVGSRAQSDAFLYDFRRTLADLIASEHYGTVAKVAHAHGLTLYGESLEGGRAPVATLGDDLEMRRFADIPMAALWTYGNHRPSGAYVADMRGAASTAHIYGRRYVAAESLTSILAPWAYGPADLQPMIDTEFLSGINRPVIHDVVLQPRDDRTPGLSLGVFGQQFGRHETWAEMAGGWIDYIARNSFLLQQGRNVADVGYFYGEEAPIGVIGRDAYPKDTPRRYAYDFVPPDAVLHELSVEDGQIVSRGGARYRALYLGGTSAHMTLPVLRKLAAFAEAGGTIVGAAPQATPSLADDPAEFAALVRRLWAGGAVTQVGLGRVFAGRDVEAALATTGAAPDFSYAADTPDADVQFVHRALADGEVYFVSNRRPRAERLEARFRVTGKAPERWRADTGAVEPVSYRTDGGETVVPLEMGADESYFVVFRTPTAQSSRDAPKPALQPIGEIAGPWQVSFQPGRGAPAGIVLPKLASLSDQADPGVRYFSGVAAYRTQFSLPKGRRPGAPLLLDLGKVGDVAEVSVNGKAAGVAWKAPYRLDIGGLVHGGRNTLEVRVADLWVNRLIGDQQPGAQKIAFTSGKTYTARAPLRPSGLLGPVTLETPTPASAKGPGETP
jgi:hypothetical protein